jgi:transposase-like protein
MVRAQGKVAYFASGVPIFLHDEADRVGQRVATAQILTLGLARQDELSRALEVNRTTLYRQQRKLMANGVLGMVDGARGPHGPHRFTAEKQRDVEALLTEGRSIRRAAEQVGVTEGTIRHALRRGELRRGAPGLTAAPVGPAVRSVQATQAPGGIAVARHAERALARMGQLTEAAPRFVAAEAVRFGGALLALPAVLMLGLLQAGDQTYGSLKKGFYGLRATLLILVFMAMLRTAVLPDIRRLVGDRRVTVVFDREGYSSAFFREVFMQQFDVLTYRRGSYADWPQAEFEPVAGEVDGRSVRYVLAERTVEIVPGFSMREIRRLCDSGHQTAILTTRHDLGREVLAYRMFERWTQENFFRYMRQQFALDALVTYAVEAADPERTVPNPERKALRRQITESRATLSALQQTYGQQALRNREAARRTMRGFKIAHADLGQQVRTQQAHGEELKARMARLPERVPLHTLLDADEIVRLAPETKHLTDTIKMVAYRAETVLVRWLAPRYARTEDEGRALVREMLLASVDILPEAHRLRVRLHSSANRRSNEALAKLCEILNALEVKYPGTDLTLVYEAPHVA